MSLITDGNSQTKGQLNCRAACIPPSNMGCSSLAATYSSNFPIPIVVSSPSPFFCYRRKSFRQRSFTHGLNKNIWFCLWFKVCQARPHRFGTDPWNGFWRYCWTCKLWGRRCEDVEEGCRSVCLLFGLCCQEHVEGYLCYVVWPGLADGLIF